jgi:DNA repair photolyase
LKAIYEPSGAAREYCELACNLYRGCTHGCLYCYAPNCLRRPRDEFHAEARLRDGVLDALARDVLTVEEGKRVHFCFTCDPYPISDSTPTRRALAMCRDAGVRFSVLTKAGARAERDFDLYGPDDLFGVTCCFTSDDDRKRWEPNASPIQERFDSLCAARAKGIRTYVSVEPIIEPQQALELVTTWKCVSEWRIGRWNHDPRAKGLYSPEWVTAIMRALRESGADFMVKEALWDVWGQGWPVRHEAGCDRMRLDRGMACAC